MHNQSYFIKGFPDYRLVRLSESKFCVLSNKKGYWEEIGSCDKKGHIHVYLANGNIKRSTSVHKLVAEMFVPNPNNKEHVHHIDFDATNNDPANLLWVSPSEHQLIHFKGKNLSQWTRKKISESHKGKHDTKETRMKKSESRKGKKHSDETRRKIRESQASRPVEKWSKDGTTLIERYSSMGDASREAKTGTGHIWSCCNGKRQTAGGYKWRYAD